jgi:hypothetical protein
VHHGLSGGGWQYYPAFLSGITTRILPFSVVPKRWRKRELCSTQQTTPAKVCF